MEIVDGPAVIYFHSAQQGLKIDLLEKNPQVCVEGDIFIKTEKTTHGITTRFESIIGFGNCCLIKETNDIIHGLKLLTEHYGYADYPLDCCTGLQHLFMWKITLKEITGKQNLPV